MVKKISKSLFVMLAVMLLLTVIGVSTSFAATERHHHTSCAHKYTNTCDKTCNICAASRSITHSYKTTTTKATLTAKGRVKTACTVCGTVKSNKVINYPKIFTLSATSYTYNGYAKKPTVTVKDAAGNVLKKDTDYTVTYSAGRKNAGTYKVTVTMKGNYTGTKILTFKINPINVSKCDMALSNTSYTYDGTTKIPNVIVLDHNGTKINESSYIVTYAAGRKNPGTYKVTVKMIGNYTGTKTLSYKINPINISTCTVKLSNTSYTYNGTVRTPTVTVTNANGVKLTKNTHYTVTYATGRKAAGTYNVTVKMKGNYTGTKTLSFKINPINISTCTVKLSATSYTFNGNVRTPTVTVTNANGVKLTKDTHYTVTYATGRKNAGTYKVTVTMKGNYKGTKTLSFKINPMNISKCTIKLSATSFTYNGNVQTPTVTATNASGVKLTKNTHYTVTYATGRKNVGTYNVTVKMKGNYTGTKTLSFKINPMNISKCTVKLSETSFTYNGNVKIPTVIVTNANGAKLTKDTHYTVTYENDSNHIGTHKVTVTMKGNYVGTKTLTFYIAPESKQDIINFYAKAANDLKNNGSAAYTKKEWQIVDEININPLVNGAIKGVLGNFITVEADAEEQINAKGSDDAKNRSFGWTLTDLSKVTSAKCEVLPNGNYKITIVMADEDTPKKTGSTLGQVTGALLYWEDIEDTLKNDPTVTKILTEFSDIHVNYKHFTITAEMTKDGKFVTLDHTADVDIILGHIKVIGINIDNKSGHMFNYCKFYNFQY